MSAESTHWPKAFWRKRPRWLWDKTAGRCAYCGQPFESPKDMTCDHLTPRSRGGLNERGNRFPCCKSCNSRKYNRPLSYLRAALHQRATGIPGFTQDQIDYLISVGIQLPEHEPYRFYWEQMGNTFPEEANG